jgi:hypothetical protein
VAKDLAREAAASDPLHQGAANMLAR